MDSSSHASAASNSLIILKLGDFGLMHTVFSHDLSNRHVFSHLKSQNIGTEKSSFSHDHG